MEYKSPTGKTSEQIKEDIRSNDSFLCQANESRFFVELHDERVRRQQDELEELLEKRKIKKMFFEHMKQKNQTSNATTLDVGSVSDR